MELTLGEYILEINVEETKDYYRSERYVSEGCKCDGCQNYELAVDRVSLEIRKLFDELGIDIKKPAEVYVNYSENDILCYGGFYHICGKIIEGESPWEIISRTEKSMTSHLIEENMICVANNYKIAFQVECSLLSENFPKPYIQMEIVAYLPWLLEKPNSYQD